MDNSNTSIPLFIESGKAARRAGLREKSLQLFERAVELSREKRDVDKLCEALYFLGSCRSFFGDKDGALAPLLEAMNLSEAVSDINFCAGAMSQLISISQDRRPLPFIVRLLEDFETALNRWSLRSSMHMVEESRAALASSRGEFDEARARYLEAWRLKQLDDSRRGSTQMSLLYALAGSCFRARDMGGIIATEKDAASAEIVTEYDRSRRLGIELYRLRLEKPDSKLGPAAVDSAREVLVSAVFPSLAWEAARGLCRAGLIAEARNALAKHRTQSVVDSDVFLYKLAVGDVALAQIRIMEDIPLIDDEVGTEICLPSERHGAIDSDKIFDSNKIFSKAEATFRSLEEIGAREDARLETIYHLPMIATRLGRCLALRGR